MTRLSPDLRLCDDLRLTIAAPTENQGARTVLSRADGECLAEDEAAPGDDPWRLAQPLQTFPEVSPSEPDMARLGRALADLALPPNVRVGLRAVLAADPVSPVRVRMAVPPEWQVLPWEFLHLGDTDGAELCGFAGLHERLRLVREPICPGQARQIARQETSSVMRVLLIHADSGAPGFPRLPQLTAEVRAVQRVFQAPECRRVDVRECAAATPVALRQALREFAPHILHVIGHADARPSGSWVALQGEREGTAACVYADELSEWIAASPVRLAVLSTCRSSTGEGGLAASLAACGVPAVVAMQLRLRDAAAGPFSRALYAALLEACAVDEALAQARQALRGFGWDWGVPILYLSRETDPVLFPAAPPLLRGQASLPPTNVPHRPSEAFVGRDGVLSELHQVLSSGRSAALVGLGGLGKTQTAAEYAHAHRSAYAGGIFWVSARDTGRLIDDLASLGRQYFSAPEDWHAADAAAWACDALARASDPTLLICDDVGAAADLRLLPPTGACRLLLTLREGYRVPAGVRAFFLPALDAASSRALLGAADALPAEQEAADDIAGLLGGLPLALALVAHHVARLDQSLLVYRERLEAAPFETLRYAARRFQAATGHDGALYDALALSWNSLEPETARVLTAAAALGRAPIPLELLWEVCGGGARAEFEEMIADLADCALLQRGSGTVFLHNLVRAFVWAQSAEGKPGVEHTSRAGATLARRLSQALQTGRLAAARVDSPHAETVADACRALGLSRQLAMLLHPMGVMACQEGRFALAEVRLSEGLARLGPSVPIDSVEDAALAADMLHDRAEAQYRLEALVAALGDARTSLRLARRVHGRGTPPLAKFYLQVGFCLRHRKRFGWARRFYNRALALAKAATPPPATLIAECLNNLGTLLEFQGQLDEALIFLAEAEAVYRAALGQDAPLRAIALNNLGRVQVKQGLYEKALPCHEEALAILEGAYGRRHPLVATSLYHAAEARDGLGHHGKARAGFREALTLYEHFYGTTNYRCDIVRARLTP